MITKPIGSNQRRVLIVLTDHGYKADELYFMQGSVLSVRDYRWNEINKKVLDDVKEIFPKSYMFWDDDKVFRRHRLILKE